MMLQFTQVDLRIQGHIDSEGGQGGEMYGSKSFRIQYSLCITTQTHFLCLDTGKSDTHIRVYARTDQKNL